MYLDRVLLLAAVFATPTVARTPLSEPPQSETSRKPCCFKNSGYAGTCKVQPAGEETCASILAYLNNPMAEGKSYCGGTTIRQGWTEVSCEEEPPEQKSSGPVRPDRSLNPAPGRSGFF
jgi:hypothetical protein